MREPSVLLVAMPWHTLSLPSIQLGILGSVLEQAGIATEVRSLMLPFMEHPHAILTAAAFSRPSAFTLSSRMRNFWTLPVTVIGNASTKRT